MASVHALPGHAVAMLLLQMALLLTVSRLLAELFKRIGQPAVIGELTAGILLGPSVLGAVWPGAFDAVFPADELQVHLLESVSWIGMVFLLLITGLETDVRLLRHLGRSALTSSLMGMVIPFAGGIALGLATPASLRTETASRGLYALFLATALSISAMPVIAKILMDLELTKRNIGVVILSAGVVDDTTGWLILSLIAGLAGASSSGFHLLFDFLKTLVLTVVFLAACLVVIHPLAKRLFHFVDDKARTANADLALLVAFAFVLSAVTERIGVHAVFGAFIAGCILRQVPTLRAATLHRLEAVALSVFAPVFFGLVGLKVDLRTVGSPKMLLIVFAVATAGKLIGCLCGGLMGKLGFWDSLAIGVAMNARGAMGLVVALIGVTLGILTPAMFAIIVVMAIGTSFMAPVLLRLIMPRLRMTPEEEARILAESQRGLFDRERLKALIPTAGGPNALCAGRIAAALASGPTSSVTLLYVQSSGASLVRRLWRRLRPDQAGRNLQEHLDTIKAWADERQTRFEVRRSTESDPTGYLVKEAQHGFDLILLGAGLKSPLRSSMIAGILERAPCHVAIVRGRGPVQDPKQILVAVDGSYFSRAALELAVLYAERVHAILTVLYNIEEEADGPDVDSSLSLLEDNFRRMMATTVLTTISPVLTRTTAKVNVIVSEGTQPTAPVIAEARTGLYQMLIVGAENRAVVHRLSVGYDVERIVEAVPCTAVVVVPRILTAEGGAHA